MIHPIGLRAAMAAALVFAFVLAVAAAPASAERVKFSGAKGTGYPSVDEVSATLQMPTGASGKVPAVIILHGSGGIDGRGEFHARALNEAGFATLEVFMFEKGRRPKSGHTNTLTHGFGALVYLAGRPDIDPKRIGVMGFSWGGNMSLRMSSKPINDAFAGSLGGLRFAAHAPFYAVWWTHTRIVTAPDAQGYGDYKAFTGAPVMLFAGGADDYGGPEDSKEFLAALPAEAKGLFSLQFYPDATHGWDTPGDRRRTVDDPVSHRGSGGQVRFWSDRSVAEDSRQKMVAFFTKHL